MTKTNQIAWKGVRSEASAAAKNYSFTNRYYGYLTCAGVACLTAMNLLAPLGYEDDSGFHYGEEHSSLSNKN